MPDGVFSQEAALPTFVRDANLAGEIQKSKCY